jgi:uncharacterized repeat protein (TIGR01451 family)
MVGFVWLLGSGVGLSHAADPVTNTLTVHRIVLQGGGHETAEPASTAKPGDLLEYVAEFHNEGTSLARGLSATLPLPGGTEFVAGSQHPAAAQASLDGTTFAPMPLKRVVREADGTSHEELVPAREYRFLRWAAMDLPGSGELSVSARVTIAAPPKGS